MEPPLLDAQTRVRHAILLRFVMAGTLVAAASTLALMILVPHEPSRLVAPIVLTLVNAVAWALHRSGRVDLAAWGSLSCSWVAVLLALLANGGLQAPVLHIWAVVVLCVCAYFGSRAGFAVAVLSVGAGALVVYLGSLGLLPASRAIAVPGIRLVTLAATLFVLVAIVSEPLRMLREIQQTVQEERARLRAGESRARRVFEAANVPLLLVSPQGAVVEINRCFEQMFGYTHADLSTGAEWWEKAYPDPEVRSAAIRSWKEAVARAGAGGGEVEPQEYRVVCKGGYALDVVISARIVEEGLLVTFVDVTARKKAEEALRHREKMDAIGQLAGGIAHDFNNQLSGIMGYAELLASDCPDPGRAQYAQRIVKAARRAGDLTRQLLAFSRKGNILAVPVDVHAIVGEVALLLERSVDRRIRVRQGLHASSAMVKGDPSQLEGAILNLALNAKDAMPEGGELAFSTEVVSLREPSPEMDVGAGTFLELRVADTGCGMSPEVRQHIFEPFFTTKQAGQGTGLGLASVFGTVRSHQGAITVESEVGRGTTFRILLPLHAVAPPRPESTSVRAGEHALPRGDASILVVDDEELVCDLLREQLGGLGYRVLACVDVEAAVICYRRLWRSIDLVVLDMLMPKKSGLELFLEMKAINPEVRAIIASGFSLQGEAQEALDQGVMGFIPKPFAQAHLARVVGEALEGARDQAGGEASSPQSISTRR